MVPSVRFRWLPHKSFALLPVIHYQPRRTSLVLKAGAGCRKLSYEGAEAGHPASLRLRTAIFGKLVRCSWNSKNGIADKESCFKVCNCVMKEAGKCVE